MPTPLAPTKTAQATPVPVAPPKETEVKENGVEEFFSALFDDEPSAPAPVAAKPAPQKTETAKVTTPEEHQDFTESLLTALFGPAEQEPNAQTQPALQKQAEQAKPATTQTAEKEPKPNKDISFHAVPSKPEVQDIVAAPTPEVKTQALSKAEPTAGTPAKPAETEAKGKTKATTPTTTTLTETQKIYMLNFGSFATDNEAKSKLAEIDRKSVV